MNIRKPVDYRAMYQSLDQIMAAELPQVKLYFEIGRAVSTRPEKGAAVMAAEYLQENYPAFKGFSPRNLRRMRKFYRAYADCEELRGLALGLGWTQNVVILEADLTAVERAWYLSASERNGWSKGELQKRISASAHSEMFLDRDGAICYTEHEESIQECKERYDQDTFYLPRQYLQKSNGRVCDERSGKESWLGDEISHRVCRYQPGGTRQSGLSSSPAKAGRARYFLSGPRRPPTTKRRLRGIRPAHRDGPGQSPQDVPDLWRRFRRQDAPADGIRWSPESGGSRSVVHQRFRGYWAGCTGGVPRATT